MLTTIWGRRRRSALLLLAAAQWQATTAELSRRGRGDRESGAFLLAERGDGRPRVIRVVYYDDLDPDCLTGAIEFDGLAYGKLWDICDAENLRVIGDVHTHPGRIVDQSPTDRANPMVASNGHVALIVPRFAAGLVDASDVGVHRYDGRTWTAWTGKAAARRLIIRRRV